MEREKKREEREIRSINSLTGQTESKSNWERERKLKETNKTKPGYG